MEEIKVEPIVKPLREKMALPTDIKMDRKMAIMIAIPIILGVLSGLILYFVSTRGTAKIAGQNVEIVSTPTEEGVKDASTFKDTATGTLIPNDGKITTEGTDVLTRGDASQNVYLTTAVIDLSKYEGKKVQVWGQTFQGQKAGWLMDVGRIKVL